MSIESSSDAPWLRADGELTVAGTAGCQESIAEIYRRFYARLVRLCDVRVGDRELAEDIAQITMLRAIRSLPAFDAQRPLWPWLRVIALRQCATLEHKRKREVSLDARPDLFQPTGDPCERILELISLQEALQDLPARQRLALQLRYLDDLGIEEAAGVIGITRNAFDQLLARGRSRLAAACGGEHAAQGVGIVAFIAFLRRATRRVSDAAPAGAAPVMGASLAMAAGVAAMLTLQLGVAHLTPSPQLLDTQVSSVMVPAVTAPHAPGLATSPHRVPAHRSASAGAPPVTTYLASHALQTGGQMAAGRLTVDTPVGSYTLGGDVDQSPGGASACTLIAGATAQAHC